MFAIKKDCLVPHRATPARDSVEKMEKTCVVADRCTTPAEADWLLDRLAAHADGGADTVKEPEQCGIVDWGSCAQVCEQGGLAGAAQRGCRLQGIEGLAGVLRHPGEVALNWTFAAFSGHVDQQDVLADCGPHHLRAWQASSGIRVR